MYSHLLDEIRCYNEPVPVQGTYFSISGAVKLADGLVDRSFGTPGNMCCKVEAGVGIQIHGLSRCTYATERPNDSAAE